MVPADDPFVAGGAAAGPLGALGRIAAGVLATQAYYDELQRARAVG